MMVVSHEKYVPSIHRNYFFFRFMDSKPALLHNFVSTIPPFASTYYSMKRQDHGTSAIIEALFNVEECSDLTLIVNGGTNFYVHKAVVVPKSDYLQKFVVWPPTGAPSKKMAPDTGIKIKPDADPREGCGNKKTTVIRIDIPEIKPVVGEGPQRCSDPVPYFEIYLKVLYCRYCLKKENLQETLAVFQVADFMISSPSVMEIFDNLLCSISFGQEDLIPVAVFCQRYSSLKNCLDNLKSLIAKVPGRKLICDQHFHELNPDVLSDIVHECPCDDWWFWLVACYAGRTFAEDDDQVSIPDINIKQKDMMSLFQDLVETMSSRWDQETLMVICQDFWRSVLFSTPVSVISSRSPGLWPKLVSDF